MEDDEAFRDDFLKDETLEKDNTKAIFRAAAARGYEFSAEDLKAAQDEMKATELSDEELEKIRGGSYGVGFCFRYGVLVSSEGVVFDTYAVCFTLGYY